MQTLGGAVPSTLQRFWSVVSLFPRSLVFLRQLPSDGHCRLTSDFLRVENLLADSRQSFPTQNLIGFSSPPSQNDEATLQRYSCRERGVTWPRLTASREACWRVMDNYAFIRAVGKGSYGEVNLVKHKSDRKQVRKAILFQTQLVYTALCCVLCVLTATHTQRSL